MVDDHYELTVSPNFLEYEFVSVGIKGEIRKAVIFSSNGRNFYNLGLADFNAKSGLLDDLLVSDNGDMRKVLRTVAKTVYIFTDCYPDAYILIFGNSPGRTRLYRMGISNNLSAIRSKFFVWGLSCDGWTEFIKGVDYGGFLIKRNC